MRKFFPRGEENELESENANIGDGVQTQETDGNVEEKDKIRKTGCICEMCKKKFRSRYHLKLHLPVHTGEKNYLCGICQKSYQQKWNLVTHMARVHGNEKPFQCIDCGKVFGYSSHFKRHIKTHFVEKIEVPEKIKQRILNPYQCEHCQKNFDSNYRLEIHLRKHSGCKPFMCDKCGTGFTTKRLVNNHIAKHHIRDFVCDKCGESFSNRTNMENHLIHVHGKEADAIVNNENCIKKDLVPCEVCGKTVMRASMRKHLNIHYRSRVYSCRFCKKEFLESGQRVIHERKHTGEKPYLCDLCGKTHSQYGNLLAHRKRSHNVQEGPQMMQAVKETNSSTCDSFEQNSTSAAENSSQRNSSEMSGESECTNKTVEEFLKIAGSWINKKFEESKAIKPRPTDTLRITLSDSEVENDVTNEERTSTVKCSKMKNDVADHVKKQMNNNILEKILEDLEMDNGPKEYVEKLQKNSKEGEKDRLKEFLKSVKKIPDNKVVKSIDGKLFWFCWVCDGKFSNRHLLSRHLLIHEPKEMRPYKCDKCQKTFTQSNNYKEHLMSHTNEHQFYCEKCGNGFRHKSHLTVHMKKHTRVISKGEPKQFKCYHCDKTFNTNFHRSEHERKHTREKPYLCKTCGRQFAAVSTLSRHSQSHGHAEYQCRLCCKLFKQKSSLKRHEGVHFGNSDGRINCECGKSFSQRGSLKKHKMICRRRIEPIVKPFHCALCPKGFLTKSDLKRHVATHDTSKSFTCKICSVRLKTGETYSRHVRRHKTVGETDTMT